MTTCVFAGTFDPPTNGHKDIIDKCLKMFDKVIIALLKNPNKEPYFSLEERQKLLKKLYDAEEDVEVVVFDGMLVDFMKNNNATVYVRGIRDEKDYEYEKTMCFYNTDMYPSLITIFIPTRQSLEHVSSSAIRQLIQMDADVSHYVPEEITGEIKRLVIKKGIEGK